MFDDIRPYHDSEIPAAINRVANHPFFGQIAHYLFPEIDIETFRAHFRKITTAYDFQHQVMLQAIQHIIANTSSGLTYEGFEHIDNEHRYMFIANHRDILLDAAILQVLLDQHHIETSEITFGSNLMQSELAVDIGKINKMFKIARGGTMHDFYRNSLEVSSYMRYAITQKHQSTWIAQRNGRTKDGDDHTESAVLKMFSMSSGKPFMENLSELNITPVTISYEYEPCDFLKTQELYIRQYQNYIKEPGEDMNSILTGIKQQKGHIHLAINPTITQSELEQCDRLDKKYKFTQLAKIIDTRIHSTYKLWNTNFIAYDLLNNTDQYRNHYTLAERSAFYDYMQEGLQKLKGDIDELTNIFLNIYANPVVSH